MSQVEINKVLEEQTAAFALDAGISKVVYQNVGSAASPSVTHLRCYVIPSKTVDPSIDSLFQRMGGTLRLQYFLLGIGEGTKPLYTLSDSAVKWFKRGKQFTNGEVVVRIDYSPNVSDLRYENNFVYVTIDVTYRCDVITT